MEHGRQQAQWDVTASIMLNARLAFSNPRNVGIDALIPERFQGKNPEPKLTPEQEQARAEAAFEAMGDFFFNR